FSAFSAVINLIIKTVKYHTVLIYRHIHKQTGANEQPHRAEGRMWIVRVGDAPVVVNPTLSLGEC
ncbi:MAG: hypothetical protein ACI31A_00125, partial [Candidatus Limisoma sp.]